ncbi:hypothetical protein [Methanoculleus bourgensis]|uniref:PGF-CTERM sorting domain-containing protein n=1 Tax=Methanoculleus bourgensis TaxID=83986 RepID=A0A110BK88_9EURY|nr:hypothetical protein [Methanoculleus bourgensis]CVK34351.1 conserved exported protein of unknown function [Methanoculleus bourgensis]
MLPKRAVLLCILVFVLAAPAAAGSIERIVTPSGNGLDITLTLTDIPVGGIVETLPDGCTWTEADHPENRTRVSGQQVAFAVIGEETIRYRVQGPPDAAEAFAGTWEDLLTGESGTVGAGGVREPGSGVTPKEAPGFLPAAALAALAVAYRWRCGR